MENLQWPRVLRALHWLTAILVLGCVATVLSADAFSQPTRTVLMQLHMTLGLSVLGFTLVRIGYRRTTKPPAHALAPLMKKASRGMQYALYVLLVALPVLGFIGVNGHGKSVTLSGVNWTLPHLAVNEGVGRIAMQAHGFLAWALVWLVAAHAVAALYHHFGRKDGVLRGML